MPGKTMFLETKCKTSPTGRLLFSSSSYKALSALVKCRGVAVDTNPNDTDLAPGLRAAQVSFMRQVSQLPRALKPACFRFLVARASICNIFSHPSKLQSPE